MTQTSSTAEISDKSGYSLCDRPQEGVAQHFRPLPCLCLRFMANRTLKKVEGFSWRYRTKKHRVDINI